MLDVNFYVNEVKRDCELLELYRVIERSITDLEMVRLSVLRAIFFVRIFVFFFEQPADMSLKDYGRLLHDGEIRMRSHGSNRNNSRHIFIFDRVLLICKPLRVS